MRLNQIEGALKKKLHSEKDRLALEARTILKASMISNMTKSTQITVLIASTISMKKRVEKIMEASINHNTGLTTKRRNLITTNMMRDSNSYKNLIASSISKKVSTNKA